MTVSYGNAIDDIKRQVNYLYDLKATQAGAILTNSEDMYDSYESDNPAAALAGRDNSRNGLIAAYNAGVVLLRSQVIQVARAIGATPANFDEAAQVFLRYMTDTGEFAGGSVSEKVTARGITRGTLNKPTGVHVFRGLYDRMAQASQIGFAEPIKLNVASTVSEAPFLTIESLKARGRDVFDQQGSGAKIPNLPIHTELSNISVLNANLSQDFLDTVDVTALTNWVLSATDDWQSDTVEVWRSLTSSIETSEATAYIEQDLPTLDRTKAYVPYVVVYAKTGFDGDIDIKIGDHTYSDCFDGTINDWSIAAPSALIAAYPEQFDADDAKLRVTVKDRTVGSISIARVGLIELTGGIGAASFGTLWGAVAVDDDPLFGANATVTDTLSVSGKIADIFADALNVSMPTSGSNTIADPT